MGDRELQEANRRLERAPGIDVALSRRLGLHVVSRLAARHRIRVQLRHSWYGGITALVMLPATIATRVEAQVTGLTAAAGDPANGSPARTVAPLPAFEAVGVDWSKGGVARPYARLRPAIPAPAPEEAAATSASADAPGPEPGDRSGGAGEVAASPDRGRAGPGPSRPRGSPPAAHDAGRGRGRSTAPEWGPWPREPRGPGRSGDRSPPAADDPPEGDRQ